MAKKACIIVCISWAAMIVIRELIMAEEISAYV